MLISLGLPHKNRHESVEQRTGMSGPSSAEYWSLIKVIRYDSPSFERVDINEETLSKLQSQGKTRRYRHEGRELVWLETLFMGFTRPLISSTAQNNLFLPLSSSSPEPIRHMAAPSSCSLAWRHIFISRDRYGSSPPHQPVISAHVSEV